MSYDLTSCLDQLATDIDKRYKQLIAGNAEEIKKEYVSKLYRLNEWCEFRDNKEIYTGRILTIGEYGRIKIEKQNGEINSYSFKEIEFIF
jgi:BirA family biotin operon repressor/biotin-[acetyl-CoA-carboxylase] ligase